jgi:hypothetical protein
VRGTLVVDLLNLKRTRGNLDVDLASIVMQGDPDASAPEVTSRAHDWLDVGASRPEALRERMRWARFTVLRIERASADAAHAGKPSALPDAAPGPGGEAREVDVVAAGELELHAHRVERTVSLRVTFVYAGSASAERDPERIVVRTTRPVTIALRTHDIQPRDPHGALVAAELGWLGKRVGREARVELDVVATKAR